MATNGNGNGNGEQTFRWRITFSGFMVLLGTLLTAGTTTTVLAWRIGGVQSSFDAGIAAAALAVINESKTREQDNRVLQTQLTDLRADVKEVLNTLPSQNIHISDIIAAQQDQKATNGSLDSRLNTLSDRATRLESNVDNLKSASGVKWK